VGRGFEGFLDLREKVFVLMQYSGAVLPPVGRFFRLACLSLKKTIGLVEPRNGLLNSVLAIKRIKVDKGLVG